MSTAAPPVGAARSGGGFGRTVLVVLGSIAALIGVGLVVAAGAIVWANATQRDDDGFFTTASERFVSPGYAITHERAEVLAEEDVPGWLEDELGTVKVTAEGERPVFVGIGPAGEVEPYLDGVSQSLVDDVDFDPFRVDYVQEAGGPPSAPPGDRDFWVASSEGTGTQTITWDVAQGDWSLVIMNADGSRGVLADVEVGGKVDWLGWAALGLAGAAVLFMGGAALLLTLGIRGRPSEPGAAAAISMPAAVTSGGCPLPGDGGRGARPGPLALALAREVVPRDPALVRARLPLGGVRRADGRRLLRDPLHRPLPEGALRLQRRRPAVDVARRLLRDERDRYRPVPAVLAGRGAGLSGAARDSVPGAALARARRS